MADDEAERAFFQAQALEAQSDNQDVATEDETEDKEDEDEDEYDPSKPLGEPYQALAEPQQQESRDEDATDSNAADSSKEDTDPAGDALAAPQNPPQDESQSSTPAPTEVVAPKPQIKTIGGFVDEDDEDEEDNDEGDYEPPAALEVDGANAMPMNMSEDPSSGNENQNTSPDVSMHLAAQNDASMPDVANSSYSPAPVPNIDPSASGQTSWTAVALDASAQNSTVPTPVPDDSAASKGRLPHDRMGILQDRVDQDPRGDLGAWLELIAEHRGRNRLDSARESYESFLKVFPTAVSSLFGLLLSLDAKLKWICDVMILIFDCRPING